MTQYIKIDDRGNKYWFKDKQMTIRHREDGPAVEWSNGDREWYKDGKRHREDGPAIEWADGHMLWYLNGDGFYEEQWKAKMCPPKKLTHKQLETLLGYKVEIIEESDQSSDADAEIKIFLDTVREVLKPHLTTYFEPPR